MFPVCTPDHEYVKVEMVCLWLTHTPFPVPSLWSYRQDYKQWFAVAVSCRPNLVNLSGKMKENVFLFIPNLIGKYSWFFSVRWVDCYRGVPKWQLFGADFKATMTDQWFDPHRCTDPKLNERFVSRRLCKNRIGYPVVLFYANRLYRRYNYVPTQWFTWCIRRTCSTIL